ncbi:hypothetical protein MKW98_013901 [Papaver atlanticum]|uniref:Uncharacterized protein n=1 Tax=Papaver atlanticum TaxID=357466 RepID=A0AAD4SDF8_9MAGN|nr:hypothetical protein MKW98_013901 [Papaver atlanticum]
MFGMISERIDQLMIEKNKSSDPIAKGCNDYDMITRKESPSLPLDPKFDSSSDLKNEFGMISESINQLMEKDASNEDDVIMMKELPSLPLDPKFDYPSSSTTDFHNYNSALENEFNCDINQWLNLLGLTNTTTYDGIAFEPFPDLIDFEFQGLNSYAGSFTDMINCC